MRYKSFFNYPKPVKNKKTKEVFYAFIDGRQAGPMSESELKILVKNGSISSSTLVWMPQLEQWTRAQDVPIVNKLLLLAHKPVNTQLSMAPQIEINPIRSDLINAIVGLGYKKNDAITLIDKVIKTQPDISLENGIKEVLKLLR